MGRRMLLSSAIASGLVRTGHAAALPSGIPSSGRIAFEAFREGRRIGTHTIDFTRSGDTITARIDVQFAVGLGPIKLYRYTMRGTEQWVGGCFATLETETNDNGTRHRVWANRTTDGLLVRSLGEPDRTLPAASLPLTHWAVANMSAPLFNPQDGKPMMCQTVPLGTQAVSLLDGRRINAEAFTLKGEISMQDWYDESQIWVKLQAKAKDGSEIVYSAV
jgi:hypothetical protein